MTYPSVSIIISFYKRHGVLERTLQAWSKLDYPAPIEFVLVDDGNEDTDSVLRLVDQFGRANPTYTVTFLRNEVHGVNTNILYNKAFHLSHNEFVIYAHMDIIPSTKRIIQAMWDTHTDRRVSVVPYYLTYDMTGQLNTLKWQDDPRVIETLPGFWTDKTVVNRTRVGANLLTCLTGQTRQEWEWFGLYRDNQEGYLWIDQDVALREQCLNRDAVTVPPEVACCYHQWHAGHTMSMAPGYRYKTEREARLLDPAERVG